MTFQVSSCTKPRTPLPALGPSGVGLTRAEAFVLAPPSTWPLKFWWLRYGIPAEFEVLDFADFSVHGISTTAQKQCMYEVIRHAGAI